MNLSSFCSVPAPTEGVKVLFTEAHLSAHLMLNETTETASAPHPIAIFNTTTGEYVTQNGAKVRETTEYGAKVVIGMMLHECRNRGYEGFTAKKRVVDHVNICPECWLDTDAVRVFMGRELCPDCAEREESAFDAASVSAWEEMDFARHDGLTSIKSVLQGMGL